MITRRSAVARIGCAAGAAALPGISLKALAAAPTDCRLVLIILRGGLDGLAAVPPLKDRDLADLRGPLAIGAREALDIDDGFALHPALKTLHGLYSGGEAAVLHAIASPYRDRSHFDGQDVLETGAAAVGGFRDGWLNRALAAMGAETAGGPRGLAVGETAPLALQGDAPVRGYAPDGLPPVGDSLLDRMALVYEGDSALSAHLAQGRADAAAIAAAGGDARSRGAEAETARTVGRLLAAPDGPRIAAMGMGGWDTHIRQGAAEGQLARQLGMLDAALGALRDGLGAAWDQSAILVTTEFGRTARVNGTGGTDHGVGGAAFAVGGAVAGGRVIADWPGLGPNQLYEGRDLAPTSDLRALFAATLDGHFGLERGAITRSVFPEATVDGGMGDLFRA